MADSYRALVARKDPEHRVEFAALTEEELGSGAVTVAVEYSTLNYKDGLAITGASPIVREYPLILGIDLAGTVVASEDPAFAAGDRVLVNGYGLSETRNGGYTERARLDPGLLVPIPEGLGTRRAMAIGTAGYTAMLCVLALEDGGVKPGDGEVLVTGAAGGVGTVAISLLAGLGYTVVASTGRSTEAAFLGELGAAEVVDRAALAERGKPLQRERWAGVVDCVGSQTLANALAQTRYDGTVAACGLAQGPDLPGTVMPFILRNVRLQGVDSVQAPMARRRVAWERLAKDLDLDRLDALTTELPFDELPAAGPRILAGEIRGRCVVPIGA